MAEEGRVGDGGEEGEGGFLAFGDPDKPTRKDLIDHHFVKERMVNI